MKTLIPLLGLCLLIAGCKSPGLTKATVQTAVSTSVAWGVLKEPRAIPYLKATVPVICSAAHGTNLSPAEVVAALEKSPAEKLKTPEGVIIINGVLGIYTAVFEAYGSDIDDQPFLQAGLDGACEGMKMALPPDEPGLARARLADFESRPHVK